MSGNGLFLGSALLFLGVSCCLAQQQTGATSFPPNCVCPSIPPMMAQFAQNMMASNGSGMFGGNSGMFGGNSGMMGGNSGMMRQKEGHGMICGSDGRNYTTPCDFVNAQAMNQNLGKRPCWSRPMNSATGSTRRPEEQKTVCLTNGQAVTLTKMQLEQQIQANPSVAIRCKGSCPCAALTCPTMRGPQGGRDFGGMMRQRMNNFQGQQTNNQDF